MERTVFYESWQMECCGSPFKIGDSVKWLVHLETSGNTYPDSVKVDFYVEEHSSEWKQLMVFTGKVESIRLLFRKDSSREAFLIDAEQAKGFEKGPDGEETLGYIVHLSNARTRRAKEEEVTYM